MAQPWRPPVLRAADGESAGSNVSWTELFYDLVFVVAIANLGRRLAADPTPTRALQFVALFGMLWWAWASVTFLVDRYRSDDAMGRLLAVAQMFGVTGFAAAVGRESSLDTIAPALAASYTLTRLVLIAMYARAWWYVEEGRPLIGGYLRGFGFDTALWAASIVVPSPWRYVLWAAAMAVSLATPWLLRRTQARSPLSASHLSERFGLFTILVLGEPVAAVAAGLEIDETSSTSLAAAAAGFLIAVALWWIYFDNLEGSVVRRDPERRHDWRPTTWIYSHFPLTVCVAMIGAAITPLIASEATHEPRALEVMSAAAAAGALGALMLVLVSTAGGDPASRRRRAIARLVGASTIVSLLVAVLAGDVSPAAYLGALACVLTAEVLFDLADSTFWMTGADPGAVPAHSLDDPAVMSESGSLRDGPHAGRPSGEDDDPKAVAHT